MSVYWLDILEQVSQFFNAGGPVLWLIAGLTFLLWLLIFERLLYYRGKYRQEVKTLKANWLARSDQQSWGALAIRDRWISQMRVKLEQNLSMIKTLMLLCPLFGLLGTVTGMIDVFTVLAINGGSDIRSMAGGVSRATIPTMAGMVAALSGLLAHRFLYRTGMRESHLLEAYLPLQQEVKG